MKRKTKAILSPRTLTSVLVILAILAGCSDETTGGGASDTGAQPGDTLDAPDQTAPGDARADTTITDTPGVDTAVDDAIDARDTSAGPVCGDSVIEGDEACDDGNIDVGDGCDATCQVEPNFQCVDVGQPCVECGDGAVAAPETCDDGDADAGDGCDATCQIEPGYHCVIPNAPCDLCGDGVVAGSEACDDGNQADGDGCDALCEQLEPGHTCPTPGALCVAERCGDAIVAGSEECDDGDRLSGDGCDFLCRREAGFVCAPGEACTATVCGDGLIEGDETCDDMDDAAPGCDAACQLEPGFDCPQAGQPCVPITCGDGLRQGLEACDDGGQDPGDGCDAACQLESGFDCPQAGQPCVPITCGDGLVQGLEACDDGGQDPGDGCSDTCAVEGLYGCQGEPSECSLLLEFVTIARFPAPTDQTQSIHYDPVTRTFTVYGFNAGDGVEFCLDGTVVGARPRPVGGQLDGATYDPFTDRFLFVQQNNTLTEVDRSGAIVRQEMLTGVNFAGGIAVGDDGRLYLSGQVDHMFHVYERFGTAPLYSIPSNTGQQYFDQMVAFYGLGLVGSHFVPQGETTHHVTVWDFEGNIQGRSTIPGPLFATGVGDFTNSQNNNTDGGEAAVDGGAFVLCSEYDGVCELFARTCQTDAECAARIPQTACKLDEAIPYCFAPTAARDDRYSVTTAPTINNLDVGRNDLSSAVACQATTPTITAVSTGDRGGIIAIAADGSTIDYTPPAGFCDDVEVFTYDVDLGDGDIQTARVEVFVTCVCGDGFIGGVEECDDGDVDVDDGCDALCEIEPGFICTGEPSDCERLN